MIFTGSIPKLIVLHQYCYNPGESFGNFFKSDSEYFEITQNKFLQESTARELLESLSKPLLFYIAAQILPWVCQLQQFLQQLFCSRDKDAYNTDYSDVTISYRPDRIFGGIQADISEAPFILSMQIFGRHFCTACIISPSSAQCFPDHYPVNKITVYGDTNGVPSFGYAHKISKVQINSKFKVSGPMPVDDIAAMKPETQ